jgi:hypothetical protein
VMSPLADATTREQGDARHRSAPSDHHLPALDCTAIVLESRLSAEEEPR